MVGVLTDQPDLRHAAKYWSVLKTRLKQEGSELPSKCSQLKMTAADGKKRLTDVADTEQLLRIIQSIPSPKAEPFKMWLAQVGRERIEETIDPEQAIDRALETYQKKDTATNGSISGCWPFGCATPSPMNGRNAAFRRARNTPSSLMRSPRRGPV